MRDFTQQRFFFIDFNCFLPAGDNPLHSLIWALTRLGEMNNKSYLHSLVWARAALNSPCTSHHSPLYFLTVFRLPYFWRSKISYHNCLRFSGKQKEISGWVKIAFILNLSAFLAWNHVTCLWEWQLFITPKSRIFECGRQKIVFFQPSELHE